MLRKFKEWADGRFVPAWRVWWRLWSMRLAAVFAGLVAYLTAVPNAMKDALDALPPFLHDSIPAWIGPLLFVLLFLARFWNQKKVPSNEEIRTPPGSQGS